MVRAKHDYMDADQLDQGRNQECATGRSVCYHVALLVSGPEKEMDDNDGVCWNLALLCTN